MLKSLLSRVVGDPSEREVARLKPIVDEINSLEDKFQVMSDANLCELTAEFRAQVVDQTRAAHERVTDQRKMIASEPDAQRRRKLEIELDGLQTKLDEAEKAALWEILPRAFAAVREAAKRTVYLRPFDVQLIGGIVLHEGKIAEMRTGEGKTLVATLPAYLNALLGRGVHIVTVNDYLARRDAAWMGALYDLLGLRVGILQGADMHGESQTLIYQRGYTRGPYRDVRPVRTRKRRAWVRKGGALSETWQTIPDRREAYEADITYGTNTEFGFDYLRDNLTYSLDERVQREMYYAIVDEVDNILIDEARTPLIISGESGESVEEYRRFARIVKKLKSGEDYTFDEKDRYVIPAPSGVAKVEEELGVGNIYDDANSAYLHYLEQSLNAEALFHRDRDYIVKSGRVILIDQHTGRLMPDRRLSDGLHQAIEAKEGVRDIRPPMMTNATVTIQNFFRMYRRLAGMTGTAKSEEEELYAIYKLGVVTIPTNVEYQVSHPSQSGPRLTAVKKRENGAEVITYCREAESSPTFYRRTDYADVIYSTEEGKWQAIVKEIVTMHCKGRPVLVGTTSVEKSEKLAGRLNPPMLEMLGRMSLLQNALRDAGTPTPEELNQPLDKLATKECDSIARELGWRDSQPTSPENIQRLADLWAIQDVEDLQAALKRGIRYQRWVRDERRRAGTLELDQETAFALLNAKEHAKEAEIIADAGVWGAVTIATSMAGRGVDIQLGGELPQAIRQAANERLRSRGLDPFQVSTSQFYTVVAEVAPQYVRMREQVLEAGGLHVLGTERHEARRIDNQLRGRAGRQGEPGSSRFYLSPEDDVMRIFGGERVKNVMDWAKMDRDMPLEHNLLDKTIEQAQRSVEGRNFDIRKHVLEYDDVLNRQRQLIYDQRMRILTRDDLRDELWSLVEPEIADRLKHEFGQDQKRKQDQRIKRQDVPPFEYLDGIMPLVSISSSPYTIKTIVRGSRQAASPSHTPCLPPFSVTFLAGHVTGTSAEALAKTLADLAEQGLQAYHDHLTERIIQSPVEEWVDGRQRHLEEEQEELEAKIGEFLSWAEEQQEIKGQRQAVTVSELARNLQRTVPFFKDSKLSSLRGSSGEHDADAIRSAEEAVRRLKPDLEALYDRKVIGLLVDQVDMGVPRKLQVRWAGANDMAEDLGRLAQEALRTVDDPRAQREIERFADDLAARKPALNTTSTLEALRGLNKTSLNVQAVIDVIQATFDLSYEQWARDQQARLQKAIGEATREIETASRQQATQLLLDIYYAPLQTTDRQGRVAIEYSLAFLPQFQARVLLQATKPDERLPALMNIFEQAVALRQQVRGEERFTRQGQETLEKLKHGERQAIVRYWARELVQGYGDLLPSQWPLDLQEAWRRWQQMRQFEDSPLGHLSDFDEIAAHLAETWRADLAAWDDLDAESQAQIEQHAIELGVFTDTESAQQLYQQRLDDLRKDKREGLILGLGCDYLERVKMQTMGDLPPEIQAVARDCLRQRGAFTDQARKQRFLVHERLIDLGEPIALDASRELARRRLRLQRDRRIAKETSADIKEDVEQALIESGCLMDQARQQAAAQMSLAQFDATTLDALRAQLGQTQLESAANGQAAPALCKDVIAYLKQMHYFEDQARAEAVRQQPVAHLNSNVGEPARQSILAYVDTTVRHRPIGEMPDWLQHALTGYLDQSNYFVDAAKLRQWQSKTVANLPGAVQSELTGRITARIIEAVAEQPLGQLAPEQAAVVQRYLDDRQLYRKRAERESLLEKRLAELNPTLRDELIGYLARTQVDSLPRVPVAELPGELGQTARAVLKRSDVVVDHEKKEILPMLTLADLEDEVRQELEKHLAQEMGQWLRERPISDLPPELQEQVNLILDQHEYLLDRKAVESFSVAQLERTAPVYSELARHLGTRLASELDRQPLGELDVPAREQIWQSLEAIGYFYDDEKRRRLLAGTLTDLKSREPAAYGLVEDTQARRVYETVAHQPVADLTDDQRRELSEYLEETGHFTDANALAQFVTQRPAALKPDEFEAVAQATGQVLVAPHREACIADWPSELLEHVRAVQGEQGRVENQGLLEQFRQAGPAALDQDRQRQLADWWLDQQTASIRDRRLAELEDETRLRVEEFLETRAASTAAASLPAGVDREELLRFAGYWARRQLARLAPYKLSSLEQEDQGAIRGFYGWRAWHEHVKDTLLNHISQLWIGYLTRIEDLQQGIGLEAFGQRDPLIEYKRRAFEMFDELLATIRRSVVAAVFR